MQEVSPLFFAALLERGGDESMRPTPSSAGIDNVHASQTRGRCANLEKVLRGSKLLANFQSTGFGQSCCGRRCFGLRFSSGSHEQTRLESGE
jgi:hypothetical protein